MDRFRVVLILACVVTSVWWFDVGKVLPENRGARPIVDAEVLEKVEYRPEESAGLFVGVRRTDDQSFSEVPFAADDAADLAYLFSIELGLIPPQRVTVLLAGSPQKPGSRVRLQQLIARGAQRRSATQAEIYRQVARQGAIADSNGLLLVSFASHGIHRDGIDFLVAQDTVPSRIPRTGVAAQEIFSGISQSVAPRRLVLVDACRERVTGTRSGLREPKSALSTSMVEAMANARGQIVLMATTEGGYSFDDARRSNGVFTAGILRGLRGAAPVDQNGWIAAGTLAEFVDRQVRLWVRANRPQFANVSRGITRGGDVAGRLLPLAPAGTERSSAEESPKIQLPADPEQLIQNPRPLDSSSVPRVWSLVDVSTDALASQQVLDLAVAIRQYLARPAESRSCLDLQASGELSGRNSKLKRWMDAVRELIPGQSTGLEEALHGTDLQGALLIELRDNHAFEELQLILYAQQIGGGYLADSKSQYGPDRFELNQQPMDELFHHLCELMSSGETSRYSLIDVEIYDGPGFWGTKQIGKLKEEQQVQVQRFVEDSSYLEILLEDGRTGFVPKAALGTIRDLMRAPLSTQQASRLRWQDLVGLWVSEQRTEDRFGKIDEIVYVREFLNQRPNTMGKNRGFASKAVGSVPKHLGLSVGYRDHSAGWYGWNTGRKSLIKAIE